MDTVLQTVLNAVPTVGSNSTYEAIYEAIEPQNRHMLPNALKQLKREGKISKGIFVVDGVNIHRITREAL